MSEWALIAEHTPEAWKSSFLSAIALVVILTSSSPAACTGNCCRYPGGLVQFQKIDDEGISLDMPVTEPSADLLNERLAIGRE